MAKSVTKKSNKKKPNKKGVSQSVPLRLNECVSMSTQQFLDDMGSTPPDNLHKVILSEAERAMIETVLKHTNQNQTKTAELLGITRATLRNRMTRYKL